MASGKEKELLVDEASDLIKGVYEGGLKTWECSLDLVDCLDGMGYGFTRPDDLETVRGKNVLEVRSVRLTSHGRMLTLLSSIPAWVWYSLANLLFVSPTARGNQEESLDGCSTAADEVSPARLQSSGYARLIDPRPASYDTNLCLLQS